VTLQPPAFVIIARQIVSTFLFDDDESKHRNKFDVRRFRYDLSFGMKSRMPYNDGTGIIVRPLVIKGVQNDQIMTLPRQRR
jgi:hypothetical protein